MSVVPVQAGGKTKYYGYWKGNDTLQALPLNVDLGQFRKVYPEEAKTDCSCKLLAQAGSNSRPNQNVIRSSAETSPPRLPSWIARSTAIGTSS